jgi:hypothetical protein
VESSSVRPPGFLAAVAAAGGALILSSIFVAVVAWPLALVAWTEVALGETDDRSGSAIRLGAIVLLLAVAQPLIAALLARLALSLFDSSVRYRTALAAMVVGVIASIVAAAAAPALAGLPVLGSMWVGAVAAGCVLWSAGGTRPVV